MRYLICLLLFGITGMMPIRAMAALFPEGVDHESALIPAGHRLLDSAYGDLDQDGIEDLVIVTEGTDPSMVKQPNPNFDETIDENPRLIGVFRCAENGFFEMIAESDSFILRDLHLNMTDPFVSVEIAPSGVMTVYFDFFASMGGWGTSNTQHKFRYQNEDMELIGYEYFYVNRGGGDLSNKSVNFSTGRIKESYGHRDYNAADSVIWRDFDLPELKSLGDLNSAGSWKFEGLEI